MTTYQEIKHAANAAGVTIKHLCEKCGVNYDTVLKWRNKEPSALKTRRDLLDAARKERFQ